MLWSVFVKSGCYVVSYVDLFMWNPVGPHLSYLGCIWSRVYRERTKGCSSPEFKADSQLSALFLPVQEAALFQTLILSSAAETYCITCENTMTLATGVVARTLMQYFELSRKV